MAAEGNHSTMVKFSDRNHADYIKALHHLCRFEKEAKAVVEKQFCTGTWQDNKVFKADTENEY